MADAFHPSLLDPAARAVIDRLRAQARRQLPALLRHYLPRLPAMLLGRPIKPSADISFFDDKLLPLNPAQGDFLYLLARAQRPRYAVEFGTSFGVSTIYLASGIRDAGGGGRVIGTELVSKKATAARENLAAAGLGDLVEIREGDARETLAHLDRPVDLLLLDGWPQLAMDILRIVEPNLPAGSIVVVDNVSQFPVELGPVVEHLSRSPWRASMLPFRGGTLVAVREERTM